MTKVYVAADCHQMPNCCGAYELGYFQDDVQERHLRQYNRYGEGETKQEAWKNFLSKLAKGYSYQFWFVRAAEWDDEIEEYAEELNDEYSHKELMEVVMQYPGAMKIAGPYINPNSGNEIQGWIIFINKE